MSFQHFRLHPIAPNPQGELIPSGSILSPSSLSEALGHIPSNGLSSSHSPIHTFHLQPLENTKKGPYGSGDIDDGYSLIFENMEAFQEWRRKEEEEKMVEFVKGDTHVSKADPPRFKDHTKLVCARHSRSGRKKYVKKYPDRVRKVPSRKLEGQGCQASISYKTYYDRDEVRACYISEHSHEIGPANLPFTKRGRRAQTEQQQSRAKKRNIQNISTEDTEQSATPPSTAPPEPIPTLSVSPPLSSAAPSPVASYSNAVAGPLSMLMQPVQPRSPPLPPAPDPPPIQMQQARSFHCAMPMLAPLPQPLPASQLALSQERWDRMGILFQSIRDHARSFEYPSMSVAALESVLIRLYLESPMGGGLGVPPNPMSGMNVNDDGGMLGMSHLNGMGGGMGP